VGLIAEVNTDPRVTTRQYSEHEVVVFVSRNHPFFHRESISIHELNGQPIIRREQGSTTRMAVERALSSNNVKVESVLDIGSREGVWKAVEQGLGIGFVADFEFIPHPRLKIVHINDTEIRTKYYIAYLSERKDSRLIKSFVEIATNPVVGK
jgi:DNA-binding transcriptional LysR family regulator